MVRSENSHLKRARHSLDAETDSKKPRRSERLSQRIDACAAEDSLATEIATPRQRQLPTPMTFLAVDETPEQHRVKEPTATPPGGGLSQVLPSSNINGDELGSLSSPPQDTQAMPSQYIDPNSALSDEVKDEVKEGVWGYLFPMGARYGSHSVVMKRRAACTDGTEGSLSKKKGKKAPKSSANGASASGYLIGRHPECDVVLEDPIVSNRHCLIFAEHKGHDTVAVLEDLSSNGTFVNEQLVGRNQRRELQEKDEIAVLDSARFVFRYPKSQITSGFHQQYSMQNRLGKGHFAEVYLCVEKATGQRYAVKVFTKTPGTEDRSKTEGLQQEIAVLMGVNHPSVLCLKDTFNEKSAVYLVLELAPEGELFNYIVSNHKLSEHDTRKLFKQLFAGVKYLHERNIVHRDIKPENILLVDRDLHVKLADFGLAKIIGEESFTTTLCGTPSYVAPEILADGRNRKYTKAVDIWSLGVVMYICLCGFPPFSDELRSPDFPFNMSQQIRSGRFSFPSPYWDSVGDPALELIDYMLAVDPERRYTIDECMAHPWMNEPSPSVNDSTEGLVGGVAGLAVGRRGITRERTLLSAINRVEVTNVPGGDNHDPIKIFNKIAGAAKEARPADNADPGAFMEHGERGDPELYPDAPEDVPEDISKDTSKDTPKDAPKDAPEDTSKDTSKDALKDALKDAPKDTPKDTPKNAPKDTSKAKGKGKSKR